MPLQVTVNKPKRTAVQIAQTAQRLQLEGAKTNMTRRNSRQ